MMIKLNAVDISEPLELWLRTSAISSVLQPNSKEHDRGIGAKIYITGEESPWLVRDFVARVISLIEGTE